ncbi:MAG TPA: AMP-binding protein [Xanthobacteraceae bacterium]
MSSIAVSLSPPPDTDAIRRVQTERKRHAVEQAKRAPFFKGKLDHVDVDRLDDPAEWGRIPILDKDMLRSTSDAEFYRDFCLPGSDGDSISEYWRSGGTTGRPLFYPRSHRDLAAAMLGFCRVFHCAGVSAPQRVHCSFPLGIHPAGQMMARAAEKCGLAVLMAGAGTTTPSSLQLELIDRVKPAVWMGMSSYALHLANLADQDGEKLSRGSVELVICSAEPISQAKREKIEMMWGARLRDSFGMTEAGMMGAEDGEAAGFRVWTDLFYIEVVEPGTGKPVPDGEVGALVVTPLFTNNVTPFLRWMSGDLVTCDTQVGGSGPFSVFPVVRHAHRTSGFFKIKGVNIGHAEFEDLLFRQRAVNDFKCEAVTVRSEDVLRVCVEIKRDCDEQAAVLDLSNAIKRTFELSADIVPLPLGTLAKEFEASIKAPRIVDRRE